LSWADADLGDKSFTITLTNDTQNEPDETLMVTLSNVTGGAALEGTNPLTVTIVNDDAPAPLGGDDGGGGAMNLGFLAALALFVLRRRRADLRAA
jgi:hypothetical protein